MLSKGLDVRNLIPERPTSTSSGLTFSQTFQVVAPPTGDFKIELRVTGATRWGDFERRVAVHGRSRAGVAALSHMDPAFEEAARFSNHSDPDGGVNPLGLLGSGLTTLGHQFLDAMGAPVGGGRAPNYTITGTLRSWDGQGGWQTVRNANVRLWNLQPNGNWERLATGRTNNSGSYSVTYDRGRYDGRDLRVGFVSEGTRARVQDPNTQAIYYYDSSITNLSGSHTKNVYISDATDGKAFTVLNNMSQSVDAARSKLRYTGPKVVVNYPASGSTFSPSTGEVNIGTNSYFEKDTIGHEFGHLLHWWSNGNQLPPGGGASHSFNVQTTRPVAFIEGYATFINCVQRNKKTYVAGGININLETDSMTRLYGIENEAAVAGAMVDIWDPSMPNCNQYWVFDLIRDRSPGDFKAYYAAWISNGWPYASALRGVLDRHGMNPPTFSPY